MTALWIIGGILLLLLLILLIPVGGRALFDEEGFRLWLCIGPVRFRLLPRPAKEEKQKKEKKPKKPKKDAPEEEAKKGGRLKELLRLLPVLTDALGKLTRKLVIRRLTLRFTFAAEDPAKAAMRFGAASAGAGMVVPFLRNHFTVKDMDIQNAVDFTAEQTRVYLLAQLSIRPLWVLVIALSAGLRLAKEKRSEEPAGERKKKYGKASDR